MKLHVQHNHEGFVFDLVKEIEDMKSLSKAVNNVIKSIVAMDCENDVIFVVSFDDNTIVKTIKMLDYRSADREMDKWIRGISYIFPKAK